VGWLIVLNLVVLAWIPFRAPTLEIASTFFQRLFEPGALTLMSPGVAIALLLVFGLQLVPERPIQALRDPLRKPQPGGARLRPRHVRGDRRSKRPGQAVPPFIYFQF
jgi:hypothetical protein